MILRQMHRLDLALSMFPTIEPLHGTDRSVLSECHVVSP
jgi:hypothetical protein